MASLLNAAAKYFLTAYDIRRARTRGGENAPPWENKSMWLFYVELATGKLPVSSRVTVIFMRRVLDFLKLATYLVFFVIIITTYGLPLNIIRDVYITARSFATRLGAFRRYQAATRNMNERYPNATEAEMSAMEDKTCIICREEMVLRSSTDQEAPNPVATDGPNMTPKKLPCGHVFHFHCLRSWLERQQSCPTWSVHLSFTSFNFFEQRYTILFYKKKKSSARFRNRKPCTATTKTWCTSKSRSGTQSSTCKSVGWRSSGWPSKQPCWLARPITLQRKWQPTPGSYCSRSASCSVRTAGRPRAAWRSYPTERRSLTEHWVGASAGTTGVSTCERHHPVSHPI
jgi:hypothetical protein